MRFAELSDEQWDFIKPHIPPQPIVGRKRADDRTHIPMKNLLNQDQEMASINLPVSLSEPRIQL